MTGSVLLAFVPGRADQAGLEVALQRQVSAEAPEFSAAPATHDAPFLFGSSAPDSGVLVGGERELKTINAATAFNANFFGGGDLL